MSEQPNLPSRRQRLRAAIQQRSELGRGGGIGVDWSTRARRPSELVRRRGKTAAAPGRARRVARGLRAIGFVSLLMLCVAAGAGGMHVWNGQNSGTMALADACAMVENPATPSNHRRSAIGVLHKFAGRAIRSLQAPTVANDHEVHAILQNLQRELGS